jgi:hypothetical protein
MERRNIEKAKGILVVWEGRIKLYQRAKKKAVCRAGDNNMRFEDCWAGSSQSYLDRMRFQQRYFTLVYAFFRGKPYAVVEVKCRQKPNWSRLRESYAVMTGELIDHDAIGKLTVWIYQTNVTREKPVQIANPMPPKEM